MNYILRISLIGVLVFILTSCSGIEHELRTEDSVTSIDNSLIVIGIQWIDTYNDPESQYSTKLKTYSDGLLNDEKLIASKEVEKDKPELYRYLYYLNKFRFVFVDNAGKEHYFIRFGKDKRQYETKAIFEFAPGDYIFSRVETYQEKFKDNRNLVDIERWKRFEVDYQETFGQWRFPAGKIVYLGDLIFYFKTKRFIFGMLTPEELVQKTVLEKIEFLDRIEETKNTLKEEKPWLPIDNIVNLASEKKWIYIESEPEAEIGEKNEEVKEIEETPKKNRKNSFY